MMRLFDRVSHPRLVALALGGACWWLLGFVFLVIGPAQVQRYALLVHLIGLALLIIAGVIYGGLWWIGIIRSKFRW